MLFALLSTVNEKKTIYNLCVSYKGRRLQTLYNISK